MLDDLLATSTVELADGHNMPIIGLGTYRVKPGKQTEDAVAEALAAGYRLIDTASIYDNECDVGIAIKNSGLLRKDVFVTTKLWPDNLSYQDCIRACEKSVAALGVDYIDLYLVHSPQQLIPTWDAMVEVQRRGLVRSIGVSNFSVTHLEKLAEHRPKNSPVVNQIEMHPLIWRKRHDVVDWCASRKITVTAYGSMFSGQEVRIENVSGSIAAKHNKLGPQILLRWALQMGFAVIPKSIHKERIKNNMDIFDFALTDNEMSTLCSFGAESLNEYWNPLEWEIDLGTPDQNRTTITNAPSENRTQHLILRNALRKNSASQDKLQRVCGCVVLSVLDGTSGKVLQESLCQMVWQERSLEWHHWKKLTGAGCGFVAGDLFPESSNSIQVLPPWMWITAEGDTKGTHVICCSAVCLDGESHFHFAEQLLQRLKAHFASDSCSQQVLHGAKVVIVSKSSRIPFMQLKEGLASLHLRKQDWTVAAACDMLDQAGMFVIPSAVNPEDVSTLRSLVMARIQDAEIALKANGEDIGSGDFLYSEIIHRGRHRWDLSLYRQGEAVGLASAMDDPRLEVLLRVGAGELWREFLETLLGEYKWEAGVVCSRPGAEGQGWHADASPSKHDFNGETGVAPAVCLFIPLVDLQAPTVEPCGEVQFGLGCTGFWPGSHRYSECGFLGSAAAEHLEATVLGAPLVAGDALVYDTRIVHSGTPNDANHLDGWAGFRPILQLTYWPRSSKRLNTFGYYQLYCD